MRIDTVYYDGANIFDSFTKCSELTILLGDNMIMLVGKEGTVHLVHQFTSRVEEKATSPHKTAYTIPLDLIMPLFRTSSKNVGNEFSVVSTETAAVLTYNGIEVTTDIYAANSLTISQMQEIDWKAKQYSTTPFVELLTRFGTTKDNVLNVMGKTLFITDNRKSLIFRGDEDYGSNFAIGDTFLRMVRTFNADKIAFGNPIVAANKNGLFLIDTMFKVSDDAPIRTYAYAKRIKTDNQFKLKIGKYNKLASIAANSKALTAKLSLLTPYLEIKSHTGEHTHIRLSTHEVNFLNEVDFFNLEFSKEIAITDVGLLKTLTSFVEVNLKVLEDCVIARLDNRYELVFNLYE